MQTPAKIFENLVSSGVDYLTFLAYNPEPRVAARHIARGIAAELEAKDWVARRWHWQGFRGEQIARLRLGEREDATVVQMSSTLARRHARDFAWLEGRISRLDMQATFKSENGAVDLVDWFYTQAKIIEQQTRYRFNTKIISSGHRAETISLGTRGSRWFARVYDKGVESDLAEPQTLWRVEVEVKDKLAKWALQEACQNWEDDVKLYSIVSRLLFERNFTLPRTATINQVAIESIEDGLVPDIPRWLMWMRRSVRPVIDKMVLAGYRQAVIDVLGLNDTEKG